MRTRLIEGVIKRVGLLRRAMTLGVRAAVIDADGRVFLVRHTYVSGWYLPGGGVERGETFGDALARELMEEGGISLTGAPELRSLHHNRGRDHVAFYVVRDFAQAGPRQPDWEIAEAGFFAPDALPEGATRATRERLAEIFGGAEVSATW
ncbi:MAG: NUDIX domain-containing protein [Hyphomicrobiales bacterium]|nr:NUDIX domain-containing protein [Hyphomicrobiales bacterium]